MTKRKTRLYQPGLFIGASIAASLALMNAVLLRCLHTLMPCVEERSRASKKNAGANRPAFFLETMRTPVPACCLALEGQLPSNTPCGPDA